MTASRSIAGAMKDSVLIVAHPDDEILWFGSIAAKVDRIIICFLHDPLHPELADARNRVFEDHPFAEKITCLGLIETNSFGLAKWPLPKANRFGLNVEGPWSVSRRCRRCARDLRDALQPIVNSAKNVFTHNPWGEYGHEEHVMVHRVVSELADKARNDVWYNNYMSNWSEKLARQHLEDPGDASFGASIDCVFMQEIADVYRRHGAWTWFDDYTWFADEYMIESRLPLSLPPKLGRTLPVNFIGLPERKSAAPVRKPAFVRKIRRLIRRVVTRREHNA